MMRFVVRFCAWLAFLPPMLVPAHQVIINELIYDPASHATNQEWIELYNTGTNSLNLAGCRFTKGIDFTFPSFVLPAGSYRVVAANPSVFSAAYPAVDPDNVTGGWSGTLANGGEALRLEDAVGNKVDEVDY